LSWKKPANITTKITTRGPLVARFLLQHHKRPILRHFASFDLMWSRNTDHFATLQHIHSRKETPPYKTQNAFLEFPPEKSLHCGVILPPRHQHKPF
jgi:hypothetical protein